MRILSATVSNFASYKSLSFDFSNKGLCLISGPTGSGKSTLCDLIPWCLYGVTAKNGSVDEVRKWGSTQPTIGEILVNTGSRDVLIRRSRSPNDLEMIISGTSARGKDLADTQRLINSELGVDAELFISGTYFHEFCQTAQFFSTSAKNRRAITEQMADLSLSKKLFSNLTEYKKALKENKNKLEIEKQTQDSLIAHLTKTLQSEAEKMEVWNKEKEDKLVTLMAKSDTFEDTKSDILEELSRKYSNKVVALEHNLKSLEAEILPDKYFIEAKAKLQSRLLDLGDTVCGECGAQKNAQKRLLITKDSHNLDLKRFNNENNKIQVIRQKQEIENVDARYSMDRDREVDRVNTYKEQYDIALLEKNPFKPKELRDRLKDEKETLLGLKFELNDNAIEISDVELLSKVNEKLRLNLVKNTIMSLEYDTNSMLSEYFEGEISVKFDISQADRIDVTVYKDGNIASYTQLSKGQRGLLKLCFGIAVMKAVANYNGFTPTIAFLDESLDGMSDKLKLQAFRLFQSLETRYESLFVVDHSTEFKAEFLKKFEVELNNGNSEIYEA